ncbi:unnamed protein product [Protopolystoma xenopodis]|uniref:Uncharacterized protein n=1 Tax=Protopolystoma xenopodis TaxID=117903 RepID=A0A3S5BFE0_9PLAT|nr:unnamed protein product [Protopolystoma xenopodis]
MARIFDKKAEIDLIRSMYIEGEELNFHDADLVKRFYSLFEIIDEPEDVGYPSATDAYPSKPRITIRGLSSALINIRSLSHEFEKWLEQSDAKGAPILLSVIEWMSENLANHLVSEPSECLVPTPNCTPSPDSLFVCLFIHSHHIVNHVKRQNILRWAKELNLCGGLMPGWPGIIVAEGTKIDKAVFIKDL